MGVSHDHTEQCLMSCDMFGRETDTYSDVMVVKVEQRFSSKCVGPVCAVTFGPGVTLSCSMCRRAYSLQA